MSFNPSKLILLKVLLIAACAVYFLLLINLQPNPYIRHRFEGDIGSTNSRTRSVFAVFLILQRSAEDLHSATWPLTEHTEVQSENTSVQPDSTDVRMLVDPYFKLPNCDSTKSFHLYILKYTAEPSLPTKESFKRYLNESFKRCEQQVPIVVEDLLIKNHSMDGRFLRGVILEAYLDNVDYYGIVLADGTTEKGERKVDLSQWKDILLQRSPQGIGVVASENAKESETVSSIFFSKVHIEIFGAAFPFSNEALKSVMNYVVWFYSSNHLATLIDARKQVLFPRDGKASMSEWTEHRSQDVITLYRYLSAVEASQGPWRSISSTRYVISMSLYGDNRRYTIGALRNAQLFPVTFPGWRLWFYCEKPLPDGSVRYGKIPEKILRKIVELGAEIQYVDTVATGLAPMLWRFLVAEDLDVDAFEVRDCDSRLTLRDAIVVSEWLKTNASFHCIRDHPSHTWHSINGGLWGGRPNGLHPVLDGVTRQVMKLYGSEYYDDMRFLARQVWPKVKDFAFCHDSVSCDTFPNSHPFPVKRIGFEHLGQVYDEYSQVKQADIDVIAAAKVNVNCTPA